nr:hypothetical protein [Oscillatoria laete-virens]
MNGSSKPRLNLEFHFLNAPKGSRPAWIGSFPPTVAVRLTFCIRYMSSITSQHGTIIVAGVAIDQPRDMRIISLNNESIEQTRRTLYPPAAELIPEYGAAHPIYANYKFRRAQIVQLQNFGAFCDITLTYQAPAGGYTYTQVPPNSFQETAAAEDIRIESHPKWHSTLKEHAEVDEHGRWLSWKETAPGSLQKIPGTYKRGVSQITVTEYSKNRFSSTREIGTLQKPSGFNLAGNNNNYFVFSSARGESGPFFTRQTIYLYSPIPFNEDIYTP